MASVSSISLIAIAQPSIPGVCGFTHQPTTPPASLATPHAPFGSLGRITIDRTPAMVRSSIRYSSPSAVRGWPHWECPEQSCFGTWSESRLRVVAEVMRVAVAVTVRVAWMGLSVPIVFAAMRWSASQASAQVVPLKARPRLVSRRRLSAAARWWSQWSFLATPR